MYGNIEYQRMWVVLGNFAQGKGAGRRPKALFISYYAEAHLIKLTWSGSLRAWPNFEVFSGVAVEKNSWW